MRTMNVSHPALGCAPVSSAYGLQWFYLVLFFKSMRRLLFFSSEHAVWRWDGVVMAPFFFVEDLAAVVLLLYDKGFWLSFHRSRIGWLFCPGRLFGSASKSLSPFWQRPCCARVVRLQSRSCHHASFLRGDSVLASPSFLATTAAVLATPGAPPAAVFSACAALVPS